MLISEGHTLNFLAFLSPDDNLLFSCSKKFFELFPQQEKEMQLIHQKIYIQKISQLVIII